MIDGLRTFQRRAGLRVDGVMHPDGPTAKRLRLELDAGKRSTTSARRHINQKAVAVTAAVGRTRQQQDNRETAFAPAIPFFVWLAAFLGVGSALVAKQRFQTFSPARQQQLRDWYARESPKEGDDYCYEREAREKARCRKRDPSFLFDCLQRAAIRRDLCVRNGGKPRPGEPGEWSGGDEEIGRPRPPWE